MLFGYFLSFTFELLKKLLPTFLKKKWDRWSGSGWTIFFLLTYQKGNFKKFFTHGYRLEVET